MLYLVSEDACKSVSAYYMNLFRASLEAPNQSSPAGVILCNQSSDAKLSMTAVGTRCIASEDFWTTSRAGHLEQLWQDVCGDL